MRADAPQGGAGFTFEEHTADLAIRGFGATLADAFAGAARGLMESLVDVGAVEEATTWAFAAAEEDLPHLLYRFLEDVRFVVETEGLVFRRFDVALADGDGPRLSATAHGEAYDAARHGHIHEVKAITLHEIDVSVSPPEVYVVVDI